MNEGGYTDFKSTNLSPNFRKLKEWGFESRMTLFWLFLCCRQKLYLHATKAIALFKDECVSKYDTFLDKAEDWTRQAIDFFNLW